MSNRIGSIWMDGEYLPYDGARIHILNHGLHYGTSVFEGIRFYDTDRGLAIFRLDEHVDRLFFSAATMSMEVPYAPEDIRKVIIELVLKNGFPEGYIRPIAYYGEKMGLLPDCADTHVSIACWPWGKYLQNASVSVHTSGFMRIHPQSSVMEAKISGHYANSAMASLEAKKAGFDEALFLDYEGHVAEGPGENIFFVREKELYTPKKGSILPGITRASVLKIAEDLGYAVHETDIGRDDVATFDEAFFVGTAVEVHAIGRIDTAEFRLSENGVTGTIRERYQAAVHGKLPEYADWLTICRK
ncbi:MAG: branched-chain amino acid transaminase [Candidatus Moranbacteria bacterium]|nr:branched-chain amino acid transaminase [Candidatus Moranbacteria bacterium]